MGASKRTKEVWTTYNEKWRQIKPFGIREPKDRVKGYRVEIRPPNSKTKIWVGTFETRLKAMRAFDAAVYLIGKEPYYHIYPGNYFPRRPSLSNFTRLRAIVQAEAKKCAEKNGPLQVNPFSLFPDTSSCPPQGSTIPESVGSHQPTSVNRQVIFPAEENLTNIVEEVDEEDLKPTQQEEFNNSSHTLPYPDYLPSSTSPYHPPMVLELGHPQEKTKVPAAYLRGLNNPSVVNALLDYPPPECFNVFPYIQGNESILDVFEEDSSLKLIPSKREHESPDAISAQFDGTPMSWSTFAAMPEDDCTTVGDGGLVESYDDHPMEDGGSQRSTFLAGLWLSCLGEY